MLRLTDNYYCAPTVFYFRPQKKWYLIYQYGDSRGDHRRRPGFSTNRDVSRWQDWTKPAPLFAGSGQLVKNWIDFWVICDVAKAHLFFTSDDGRMWRADTALADFPHGWSKPVLALEGDILRGQPYLSAARIARVFDDHRVDRAGASAVLQIVHGEYARGKMEPGGGDDGASRSRARRMSSFSGPRWADSISHGELFRLGIDERMEVDPAHLRLLFQGVSDAQMKGKPYGEIPWRLGILDPAPGR